MERVSALRRATYCAVLTLLACQRPQGVIHIDGSPALAPLLSALGREYGTRNEGVAVNVMSGLASGERMQAVASGQVHLAMASHKVDSAELAQRGLDSTIIARMPVLFAVNSGVTVTALTSQQICDIYAGRIRNWNALGGPDLEIRAGMRPPGEVDGEVVLDNVSCMRGLPLGPNVQMIERPDEMAHAVSTTAGAIGVTSAPMVAASGGKLRAVTLDGREPTAAAVADGSYLLYRRAILIHRREVPAALQRFLDFIAGPDGQRIMRDMGAL